MGYSDNEGGYAWVETEDLWEISVPFLKFSCEPYGALKVVLIFFFNGLTRTTAVQNAGKPQFSYSAGRNVNHQSYSGKQFGSSSNN